jgi:hypothetical protein
MSDGPNPFHLVEEVTRRITALVPPEATKHFLNAEKELLLGVAALVERNGRQEGRGGERGGRRSGAASRSRRPRRVVID